jgi:hypothetical protein
MLIFSVLCAACNAATCSGDGVLVKGQHQGDKSISDTHKQEYLFAILFYLRNIFQFISTTWGVLH